MNPAINLSDSEITSAFQYCDNNHDNLINLQECRNALRYIGYSLKVSDLERFISEKYEKVDSNRIKLRDFIKLARNSELPTGEASRGEIEQAFRSLDRDGDGLVRVKELKKLVTRYGEEPMSEEEIRFMMKGINGDDMVMSSEDFQNLMKPLVHSMLVRECSLQTCEIVQKLSNS